MLEIFTRLKSDFVVLLVRLDFDDQLQISEGYLLERQT